MLIPPKAKAIGYPQHIFMIQLKTLNDLNVTLNTKYYLDKKLKNIVPIYDLRQEAIKWIKETEKHNLTNKEYQQGQKDWIINFFNINEEDLK